MADIQKDLVKKKKKMSKISNDGTENKSMIEPNTVITNNTTNKNKMGNIDTEINADRQPEDILIQFQNNQNLMQRQYEIDKTNMK